MRRPPPPSYDENLDDLLREMFQSTWGRQAAPQAAKKGLLRSIWYAHLAGELVMPSTVENVIIRLEQSLLLPLRSQAKPWGGLA